MGIMERDRFMETVLILAEAVYDFHELWDFTHDKSYEGRTEQALMKERIPIIKEEVKEWQESIKILRTSMKKSGTCFGLL